MITTSDINAFAAQLRHVDQVVDNRERIDQIRALESVKSAICAEQATISIAFEEQVRAERRERGVPKENRSKGVASELALARRESPFRGSHLLGQARVLIDDMPHALELLKSGVLNEWRVSLIIKEIICLDSVDRQYIDQQLCSDPATLDGLGDRAISGKAFRLAVERDQAALVERARKAPGERCVTSRPAPDSMAYLTGLLPMKDAVAVHATLSRDADTLMCTRDVEGRTKNQIMADLLVERCTGVSTTELLPVEVVVVISDDALLAGGDEPAHVQGYGPVPAAFARSLIADSVAHEAKTAIRKLYAQPTTGTLTAMESTARFFPKALAKFIDLRDRWCRTPYCNAPIRHHDHVTPRNSGGATSEGNGAGLCAKCNLVKEAEGWSVHADTQPEERHSLEIVTPTGHRYRSTAPEAPRPLDIDRKAG